MKQITLHIPDKKVPFFMELIKSLKFIKKVETEEETSKEEILQGIKEAVDQVNLAKQGKVKLKSARDLLNELWCSLYRSLWPGTQTAC